MILHCNYADLKLRMILHAVDKAMDEIDAAGHEAKNRTVLVAVRTLTECKKRAVLKFPVDTPHERWNELHDFVAEVLNALNQTLYLSISGDFPPSGNQLLHGAHSCERGRPTRSEGDRR